MADIEDEIPQLFEDWARWSLEEAEDAEREAADTSDPERRQFLLEYAERRREAARGEMEKAAIADDPDALTRWWDGLTPERREEITRRNKRLLDEGRD